MKQVPLNTLFDVYYGVNLDLNKLEQVLPNDSHAIPFVSRTSQSNGVSAFVKRNKNIAPNPSNTLSVAGGGSVLETFYQKYEFYSGRDLYYLKPKTTLNEREMLVYCSFIRANKYRYNFGRQANKTLSNILLPELSEAKKIAYNINVPNRPSNKPETNNREVLDNRGWKYFHLGVIFTIKKGKRLTKANMIDGTTPFIGAIDSNNGVSAYVGQTPIFEANTITVNYDGNGVAEAYYQDTPYWALDSVNVLYPNFKLNVYISLFLITIIKKEKFRFNYGRKWHSQRMKESKIKLPVDSIGEPDWEFMEAYIKSLPYSSNLA